MMNKEMLHRLKIAGEYQRKAIRALFPEETGKRLDVIEKEMKMMVMEAVAELLKNCNMDEACRGEQSYEDSFEQRYEQSSRQTSKVKKVDIM